MSRSTDQWKCCICSRTARNLSYETAPHEVLVEDLKPESGYSRYYQQQIKLCQEWKSRSGSFAAELAVARLIDRKLEILKNQQRLEEQLELDSK